MMFQELTITGVGIPILAILSAMSEGDQIEAINFSGWDHNEAGLPESWKAFLAGEKTRCQDGARTKLRWIRSSGADL